MQKGGERDPQHRDDITDQRQPVEARLGRTEWISSYCTWLDITSICCGQKTVAFRVELESYGFRQARGMIIRSIQL